MSKSNFCPTFVQLQFQVHFQTFVQYLSTKKKCPIFVQHVYPHHTAVSSEAWAKLREWAILAGKGRLLLSGSVVLASLKAAVQETQRMSQTKL